MSPETRSNPAGPPAGPDDSRVADALAEYQALLDAGRRPARAEFLARHPDVAAALAGCLDMLAFVHSAGRELSDPGVEPGTGRPPMPAALGDFRIVREVGRGGMGVVYEAEQLSLGRRVALKVLPFAAVMDPRHLQRFKNEARAAAALDHPHAVKVYGVGQDRGVHYIAMQYVDGLTLADLIRERRGDPGPVDAPPPAGAADPTRTHAPDATADAPAGPRAGRPAGSTSRTPADAVYVRRVAEWGIQAAEALEHAHALGIVHRDVKPGNLLVDARGAAYVADFGLAKVAAADPGVTGTGDVLGTVRYMSPEQAAAKHDLVDHRSDVYSLGATLYELLTLTPAFGGADRRDVLSRVLSEDPPRPGKVDRRIPRDLETVVLKAMAKDPAARYQSAEELAADLRRFLAGEPVRAKRAGVLDRAGKWARRHRAAVGAAVVVVLLVGLLGGGAGLWWAAQRAAAEREGRAGLEEAVAFQREEKWPEALSSIRRAQGVLAGVGADPGLRRQVDERGRDLEMVRRLEEARLRSTAVKDGHFDYDSTDAAFAEAFLWYGLDVDRLSPEEVGERVRTSSIRVQLGAALTDWAKPRHAREDPSWRRLVAAAGAVDLDPWRDRLRAAIGAEDRDRIVEELVSSVRGEALDPPSAVLLAQLARGTPASARVLGVLRRVQQRHPADFWVNQTLGNSLTPDKGPGRPDEAIRYLSVAVALRPQSPGARQNLAYALMRKGLLDEAILEYREALRLKGDYKEALVGLCNALTRQGRSDEVIALCRDAIRVRDSSVHRLNLGVGLWNKGQRDAAAAEFRQAIRLESDHPNGHPLAYAYLGLVLLTQGRSAEALPELREAIRRKADQPQPHAYLAWVLATAADPALRDPAAAVVSGRRAVELNPNDGEFRNALGVALYRTGAWREAIAELNKSVELHKQAGGCNCLFLAMAHWRLGEYQQARAWYDRGVQWMQMNDLNTDPTIGSAYDIPRFRAEAEETLGLVAPPPRAVRPR